VLVVLAAGLVVTMTGFRARPQGSHPQHRPRALALASGSCAMAPPWSRHIRPVWRARESWLKMWERCSWRRGMASQALPPTRGQPLARTQASGGTRRGKEHGAEAVFAGLTNASGKNSPPPSLHSEVPLPFLDSARRVASTASSSTRCKMLVLDTFSQLATEYQRRAGDRKVPADLQPARAGAPNLRSASTATSFGALDVDYGEAVNSIGALGRLCLLRLSLSEQPGPPDLRAGHHRHPRQPLGHHQFLREGQPRQFCSGQPIHER